MDKGELAHEFKELSMWMIGECLELRGYFNILKPGYNSGLSQI